MEPESFEDAMRQDVWVIAMKEEINMIKNNETWELVNPPANKDLIGVKEVYKEETNPDNLIQKYKARLVAKGYNQRADIDYDEVFALVAQLETIRLIISLAAQNN